MILQSLVEYYEAQVNRNEIVPLNWCTEKVSFALNIAPDGTLLNVVPLLTQEMRGKKEVNVPSIMQVPEKVIRSSGIKPNFLCDNTSYCLGVDSKGDPKRTLKCFASAKEHHHAILQDATGNAAVAIKHFFNGWQPEQAREHPALLPYLDAMETANLVFMLDGGAYAHEDAEAKQAWLRYKSQNITAPLMRCLATGKTAPVALLHGKIKGVPGAQSAGANLISSNANAYDSYGKGAKKDAEKGTESLPNAPVSEYAAFAYTTALNALLANREHKHPVGDATVVYWAQQAAPKPPQVFSAFAFPDPRDNQDAMLSNIMNNIAGGKPVDGVDLDAPFYILGISPNAARLSVRFFLRDNFGNILHNLTQHYERLNIQKPAFDRRLFLSVSSLLAETVNPNSKNKAASPQLSGETMRAILTNTRYPQSLLQAVMGRIHAQQDNKDKHLYKITRGRVAIIKAVLLKDPSQIEKEMLTVALNEQSNDRAYVLGRLFAVLENAQLQANPAINTTIKDRFFTSACATPAHVFPQLLKLSVYHTSKAEYGKHREIEKAKLLDKLSVENNPLPAHLSLNEQGIFILGYYHQVQARYIKKEDV